MIEHDGCVGCMHTHEDSTGPHCTGCTQNATDKYEPFPQCEWIYIDDEYYWKTSCNHLHVFLSDGPKENEYKYCPYCGKKIKVGD